MCCGHAYEYAHAESLNSTSKYKEINLSEYENFDEAQKSIFRFIDLYNTTRLHSDSGWIHRKNIKRLSSFRGLKQILLLFTSFI